MVHTNEQVAILQDVSRLRDHLGVIAGAGCGKSTMARMACNQVKSQKRLPLYLAFNRSAADEFKMRGNIDSLTHHSFSRQLLKRREKFQTINFYTTRDVREILKVDYQISQDVLKTLHEFFYSAELEPTIEMVPPMFRISSEEYRQMARRMVLRYTKDFWQKCKKDRVYSHDGYIKVLQTDHPDLLNLDYDLIAIDEYQDTNPAFAEILNRHPQQKLCIGDPMQSIYQWRGAIDAFDDFSGKRRDLSISFRFPDEIANIANFIISQRNSDFRLKGLDSNATMTKQTAYLHRSNIGCLLRAKELLDRGEDFVLQSGVSDEEKGIMSDMRCLATKHPEWVKTHHCMGMSSYEDIKELISLEDSGYGEWSCRERLIGKLGGMNVFQQELKTLEAVSKRNANNPHAAVVITAHKAKGLEYPRIVVGSDFLGKFKVPLEDMGTHGSFAIPKGKLEEQNLLYVAVTRARKVVNLQEVKPLFPNFDEEVGTLN